MRQNSARSGRAVAKTVAVVGDIEVECRIATDDSLPLAAVHFTQEPAGAALLAEILERVARSRSDVARPAPEAMDERHAARTWQLWSEHDGGWRMDRVLGVTPAAARVAPAVEPPSADPAVVVIDDCGGPFRDSSDRWPALITAEDSDAWVVLRMGAPVTSGQLWQVLDTSRRARLVVVVEADDLRADQVQISSGLSWERTAQDLVWELRHSSRVGALADCSHAIVLFGAAGALVASRDGPGGPRFELLFDPEAMEHEWERDHRGSLPGAGELMTAYVATGVIEGAGHERLCEAVASGLDATGRLQRSGYQLGADGRVEFPFARVLEDGGHASVARVEVPDPARYVERAAATDDRDGYWTILDGAYGDSLDTVAARVAVEGGSSLTGVPHGRFGKFFTVDRREIEALRAIRSLMEEYCALATPDRPVSIAVFGPPGSGKSFGVAQVASSLPGRIQKVEFNLSQFASPDALTAALHVVRDISLSGSVPLVFWDEFDTPLDSVPLGWLRYFLAPMQDGAFREGQLVHPIGRAIFVFAGGTAASMREFGNDLSDEQRRAAKHPDFVSRLRGYLDVLGPNPQGASDGITVDRTYRLRRAILFESLLKRKAPQLIDRGGGSTRLNVDAGVLRAFLEVPFYRHGARSMESVIDMSRLSGHRCFERSCLPSESQLALHVNSRQFLALVHRLDLSSELLERLAAAMHGFYRSTLEREGYRYGPVADEARRLSPNLCSFEELPEALKEQNRAAIRDIPNKLASGGYVMVPGRSNEKLTTWPPELLENLARIEHIRWMDAKLADGWERGPRDDAAKRHDSLVPWEELPESEREKDRAVVAGIGEVLGQCGYAVVPAPG